VSDEGSIHPKNAAGPFYVLNGCCTACGVPTAIAPELFEFDSTYHCYVKRQPSSNAEMEKALHVLRGQELGCVRYRGTDEAILRRLAEAGEAQQCDHPPAHVGVVLRNMVTFAISDSNCVPRDGPGFLEEFSAYLKARYPHLEVRTKPIELREGGASFALAWFKDHFHPITIHPVDESGRWLESLSGMGETPRLQAKPSGGLRYDGRLCANCVEPPTPFIVCTTTSCSPPSIASRCWWGTSARACGI